ncbi:MAG: EAL domain-containing protein [Acidobacteria bacterium]|nr:EAL domain-containing protein [Acidobacteriota bacterium]
MTTGGSVKLDDRARVLKAARVAGLDSFDMPTLAAVERRRMQLWVMTLLLLVALTLGVILLTVIEKVLLPSWLSPGAVHAGFLGLVVLFCGYAVEKEIQLRRLARLLIKEMTLTAALTNRLGEVSSLLESGKALNLDLDLGDVAGTILRCARDLLEGHDCSLQLLYGEDELRTVKVAGESAALGARIKIGEGIAGQVAENRDPVLINGLVEHKGERQPVSVHPSSAMSVPLVNRGQLLGVLNINAGPGRVYTEHDLRAFSLFGEQAAIAITNAQLFESQQLAASRNSFQALHDGLTGLANRSLFLNRLDLALSRRRQQGRKVAVLFIDLDDFKRINDQLGHVAGDELLVQVGVRLKESTRAGDTVARLGGDEFGVVIEDLENQDEIHDAARRILDGLARPFALGAQEVGIGASVGAAFEDGGSAEQGPDGLLSHAAMALHASKEKGKGGVFLFDRSMKGAGMHPLDLENELRSALEMKQIIVHYQPIFSIDSYKIMAIEALARWRHPTRGFLAAGAFIPAAMRCGLLGSIDQWILETSCRAMQGLRESWDDIALHVNLSPTRFGDPGLARGIGSVLDRFSIPASNLCLEITESAILRDTDATARLFADLHSLGVRVALDDFGTGYSSLSHLRRYPIDCLKIDRSFIDGMNTDPNGRRLVESIIRMGQGLDLEVVAEGVEDASQLQVLETLGCACAQGFFLAKPMALEDLKSLLAT